MMDVQSECVNREGESKLINIKVECKGWIEFDENE